MRRAAIAAALFTAACFMDERIDTLRFPDSVSLGSLHAVEDLNCFTCGTGNEDLGEARGVKNVHLPAERWYISLTMPKQAAALMPFLDEPSLDAIGDLQLAGSDVRDDDLRHVARIDLRSIDLSRTDITGEGLRFLHPHRKWIFVTLTDCQRLDPKFLAHFRGWTRSTIRVPAGMYAEARHVICDDRPEQVCGVQIRPRPDVNE